MRNIVTRVCVVSAAWLVVSNAWAQESEPWYAYQLVPHTVYEKEPVTVSQWVDETVMVKQKVTTQKPVIQTERRERKRISYKPVRRTEYRERKVVVYEPVEETLYREKRTQETIFETETRYRDEEIVVREPIVESGVRLEKTTVRKPVTEELIEVKRTTTYKPVVRQGIDVVPGSIVVPGAGASRPRLKMLDSGYYTDPATGLSVYRRRGLHWVDSANRVVNAPVAMPAQRIDFVPETVEERNPVEVTRYVDEVETKRVPYETEKVVERIETRRVPYEVKVAKPRVTVEKIPYTKTTYKERVTYKKEPYTTIDYIKVEENEPYEVEVQKWVPFTREIEVPKTVRKKVDRELMKVTARTVMLKVPVDDCGNWLASPSEVYAGKPKLDWSRRTDATVGENNSIAESTTTRRVPIERRPSVSNYRGDVELVMPGERSILNKSTKSIRRDSTPVQVKPVEETSGRDNDETGEVVTDSPVELMDTQIPSPVLPEVDLPEATGDESAAERAGIE